MAILLAIVVIVVVRNHRVLLRYRFVSMFTGIALLLLELLNACTQTGFQTAITIFILAINLLQRFEHLPPIARIDMRT